MAPNFPYSTLSLPEAQAVPETFLSSQKLDFELGESHSGEKRGSQEGVPLVFPKLPCRLLAGRKSRAFFKARLFQQWLRF
jgi:hypothetical protein